MTENRRQFQRIEFDTPVVLSQNDNCISSDVIDISLKGLLVKGENLPFDLAQPINIRIDVSEQVQIAMIAQWAYSREGVSGFSWTHVDLDSLVHLRRLLEFNSENALLLERELSYLSKDKDAEN